MICKNVVLILILTFNFTSLFSGEGGMNGGNVSINGDIDAIPFIGDGSGGGK